MVSRLVLTQFGVMWLAMLGITLLISFQTPETELTFGGDRRMSMVLGVASALEKQPQELQRQLERIDNYIRYSGDNGDRELERVTMTVRQAGKVIFASYGSPGPMPPGPPGQIVTVQADGRLWYTVTATDEHGGFSVTLARYHRFPFGGLASLNGLREVLLSFSVLLPLTLIPGWMAMRWAARPIRRLGEALAARDRHDLAPLTIDAKYKELWPIVDAVNAWLQRLRASNDRERYFLANAAHELRTPLTAIRIYGEALALRVRPAGSEPAVKELLDATARAVRVTEQMLVVLRNDTQTAGERASPIELRALVQSRMAVLSQVAMSRDIDLALEAPDPLEIQGHEDLLISAIDNLVDNALRYSPPGAAVLVNLRRERDDVVLAVEDSGPGIAPELREAVFERFRRLPGSQTFGSGLGLSIVRGAIAAHLGVVTLNASPRLGGLLATLRWPVAPTAPMEAKAVRRHAAARREPERVA